MVQSVHIVYAVTAMYALSYMAQVPLLPYLMKELGLEGGSSYGRLQFTFSLAQMLGGLLAGPVVDRWGGRALLLLSLWSSVVCYALTASASHPWQLYLSRVCTLMQHAILAARTLVAANSPSEQRALLIGYVGVAYGIGFAIGPAVGGVMSQLGLRTTAWVATGTSALSAVVVMVLVPGKSQTPTTSTIDKQNDGKQASNKPRYNLLQPLQVLKYSAVRQLIATKLMIGLAGALLQSVFTLMLKTHYGLSSKNNGLVLSSVGVLTMASQALLVEPTRRYLGEARAVHLSCVSILSSYIILAVTPGRLWGLIASMVPGAAGGAVLSTINTAQLTQAAPADVVGSVLALDMSLFSAVRLFTPVIGTVLLDRGGVVAIGLVSGGFVVALLLAIQIGYVKLDGGAEAKKADKAMADLDKDKKE